MTVPVELGTSLEDREWAAHRVLAAALAFAAQARELERVKGAP